MIRLPSPGGDDNVWGAILNEFLLVEHSLDGTLRPTGSLATKYTKPAAGIPRADLDSSVVDALVKADNSDADATSVTKGHIQLAGDLGGIAGDPKTKSRAVTVTIALSGMAADYICDGTADNIQIQAAIDAVNTAGGGIVHIRTGVYDVAATIYLKNNVSIVGEGWNTILRTRDALNDYPLRCSTVPTTNVTLRDIKFDLNGPGQTTKGYLSLTAIQHFTFDHVYFYNSLNFALLTQASGDPITGVVPKYGVVKNCRFDTQTNTVANQFADFAVLNLQYSRIVNNYWGACSVVPSPNYALSAGRTMRHTIIANNTFEGTNMTAIGLEDIQDCIIEGNEISGASGGIGIFINNFNSGVAIQRNIISSNTVRDCLTDGIKVGELAGADDMLIVGNACCNNGRDGISIYGASLCQIANNRCKNNNQANYASPVGSGIRISGGSPQSCQIFGNQCTDSQSIPTQSWGIYAGNGDNFLVHANKVSGNVYTGISIPGNTSHVSHNDTGVYQEAHGPYRITDPSGRQLIELRSDEASNADNELFKVHATVPTYNKHLAYFRNAGTDAALQIDQVGTPVNSFDPAIYLNVTHSSTNAGALRTVDATPATSVLLDKNNIGLNLDADQDVTNTNWSSGSFRATATSNVTDGNTYTKSGTVASITSDIIATSGTITDTADVLKVSQLNAGATGAAVYIDNRGVGKSFVIKNDTTETFSVAKDGTIIASNKITNLTDPSSAQDAATKAYVDAHADATSTVHLAGAETITGAKTFSAAPLMTAILDSNGVNVMGFSATASANAYFTFTNANASSPIFSVDGTAASIGFLIKSKSSGVIALRAGANSTGVINFQDATGNAFLRGDSTNSRVTIGASATAPTSVLTVLGAISTPVTTKTTGYTLTTADSTVVGDASTSAFSLTLPTAVGIAGRSYIIKKVDASGNAVTITAAAGQTIDGASNRALTVQFKCVTIQSDGANWIIVGDS